VTFDTISDWWKDVHWGTPLREGNGFFLSFLAKKDGSNGRHSPKKVRRIGPRGMGEGEGNSLLCLLWPRELGEDKARRLPFQGSDCERRERDRMDADREGLH
jgi:hypothetical protein